MNPINEHDHYRKSSLPPEMVYADDSDFVTEDNVKDKQIEQISETVLSRHSLKVNNDKCETTTITGDANPEIEKP